MPRMTPEQEAGYALDFGVARSDLPEAARLAYDRLAEQRARGRLPGPDSAADAKTSQMVRLPVSPAGYSVAELGPVIAADVIALAAAVGLYLVIAVTSIASWPANRVLVSAGNAPVLAFAAWVLYAYALVSSAVLYGWGSVLMSGHRPRLGEMLRAMYWGASRRPSWARLPTSMRRPPGWMWLLLAAAAAGSAVVISGNAHAGMAKSSLRVLPGPRYEVSTSGVHNYEWTEVSRATYQAYAAGLMRLNCLMMPILLILIAYLGYALFLRCALPRRIPADSVSPASPS